MLGFVVTPTTALSLIRAGRACGSLDVILARDKSSSQIEVPAAETWCTDIKSPSLLEQQHFQLRIQTP